MQVDYIITQLEHNKEIIPHLLEGSSPDIFRWKPSADKWCMLEIVCHLVDEEAEDFRTRVGSVLEDPDKTPPAIDPGGWVTAREYVNQDFEQKCLQWQEERARSVSWLKSLVEPKWDNEYLHPKLGPMSARLFLVNWLAHDYLHIRQITRLKYDYLSQISGEDLGYAGNWI